MQIEKITLTADDGTVLSATVYTPDTPSGKAHRDVLLLHGWPNSGRIWKYLAEELLAGGDYRLIAPDFRGFGDSARATVGYTCARFAADAAAVAQAVGLSDYVVVGHSMGGKIAQTLAALNPPGLVGLALIAPVPLGAGNVPEEKRASQRAIRGDVEKTREMLEGFAARPLKPERLAILVEDAMRAGEAAWNGWLDPMREEDLSAEYPKIAGPTKICAGGKDPLRTPEALQQAILANLPEAKLEVLPQDGHLPHVEEPTALALVLVNFFDELPGTTV